MKNLSLACRKARKGKTKKNYVLEFEKNLRGNLIKLHEEFTYNLLSSSKIEFSYLLKHN